MALFPFNSRVFATEIAQRSDCNSVFPLVPLKAIPICRPRQQPR